MVYIDCVATVHPRTYLHVILDDVLRFAFLPDAVQQLESPYSPLILSTRVDVPTQYRVVEGALPGQTLFAYKSKQA